MDRDGTMSDAAQPRCRIVLEDWNPNLEAAVWADPSSDALRTGIDALADLLTSLVEARMKSPSSVRHGTEDVR